MMLRTSLVLLSLAAGAACSGLPRTAAVTDQRALYVWPAARCPALAAGESGPRTLLSGVGATLLGDVASALVGVPVAALAAAAEADERGFTASGINARYYYTVEADTKGNVVVAPPSCYIVALARPAAMATAWCDDPAFQAGLPASCANGRELLAGLSGREPLQRPRPTPVQALSVPAFYAEIGFDLADHGRIVRPAVTALYYPDSLLRTGSRAPRTLALTIAATSPQKDDPLRSAAIALHLIGVVPGAQQPAQALQQVQTGWTSVPAYAARDSEPRPEAGRPFMPVTMTATLHEVGEPNVFLAAFAKAFAGSAADYAGAITRE